jgi:hypothetical protein
MVYVPERFIGKEEVVTYSKVLSENLPAVTVKEHENLNRPQKENRTRDFLTRKQGYPVKYHIWCDFVIRAKSRCRCISKPSLRGMLFNFLLQ